MASAAKMLFFLPKKHQKMIRYYGLYAHGAREKQKKDHQRHLEGGG
ncbi:MAG: hypothetical protein KBA61_06745 [Spirochaetes bacterium]|nr:hypothetical protein [Spirochaetota bacterium]